MNSAPRPSLQYLSQLLVEDMAIRREARSPGSMDGLIDFVIAESLKLKTVYTAFDGDHQMMCGLMRKRAILDGVVPANPDSILGYKETLEARKTKGGVLLDDLSVLRGCDELWVFTDEEPTPASCVLLAEGVLIELLFFLKRYPSRPVKFFRVSDLLRGNWNAKPIRWDSTYVETKSALREDQRDEILQLANSGHSIDHRLRDLTYFLIDPLDYKYARFVRAYSYKRQSAPIVPYLAIRVEDFDETGAAGRTLLYWSKLLQLAASLVRLAPLEPSRPVSQSSELLQQVWLRSKGSNRPHDSDWLEYHVPKAQQEDKWAITFRERRDFRGSRT